jgi:hypothetical protein
MGVYGGPNVITSGLVLSLDAGNTRSYPGTGTTWTDLSGNNNTGTLVNGPTFSTANNGYLVLDGTNDYVTSIASLPNGTNLFTYSVWIYFTSISGNFGPFKASALLSGNAVGALEFYLANAGDGTTTPATLVLARYGGSTTGSCVINVTSLMSNLNWYNIVLVRDGSASQQVYLNGVNIGSGTVSNGWIFSTVYIGGAPLNASYSGYHNGRISNAQLYNRALTAEEVTQNFNALRGRFGI